MNAFVPGVTFGTIHSYNDWGVYWNGWSESSPEPQKNLVSVPYKHGTLDVTKALTDKIFYKSRKITIEFISDRYDISWSRLKSKVYGDVHGKSMYIYKDTDPDYYWDCTLCTVSQVEEDSENGFLRFTIECDVFPYKFKREETTKTIAVTSENSTVSEVFLNSRMEVNPTFTATQEVELRWTDKDGGQVTIVMSAGVHTYDVIEFYEGENTIIVKRRSQDASLTVSYREGDL